MTNSWTLPALRQTFSLAALTLGLCVTGTTSVFAQATVDESPFAKTGHGVVLYVNQSPGASDKNTGRDAQKPLATIGQAVMLAHDLSGTTPVKIKVGAGTYREHLMIDGGPSLLEIEGTVPGKVIISGSQAKGWELAKWTPVAGVPGLYKKAWPFKLGFMDVMGNDQGVHYPNLVLFRREAVYVNGAELTPVQLEDYTYDFNANPRNVYHGYHDPAKEPSVIPPGSFAVNDQKSDHADSNTVFLRLPTGVDPKTATIEVPDDSLVTNSKKLLVEIVRSNFVMRNITVEHASCLYNTSAVGVNLNTAENDPEKGLRNILIENCDFNWNNGVGLGLNATSHFTIRHCRALHNGNAGMTPWSVSHMLLEDCNTSYNAWIAAIGQDGWVPAGVKGLFSDSTVRRHTADYNGYVGFWLDCGWDGGNARNTFEDCDFSYNIGGRSHGLLFEIATGPNTVRRCRMIGNGGNGVESSYGARQTFIDHCIIVNNGNQLSCVAQAGAKSEPDNVLSCQVTNSIIASDKGEGLINFYNENSYLTDSKALPGGGSRFQASGNTYWSNAPKGFKVIWWDGNIEFADWQKKSGQDVTSKWEKPDLAKLLTENPAQSQVAARTKE